MIRIAVIEDDLPIAHMYEHKLKGAGFDVKLAHNGVDGLELLEDYTPDLVLLDIRMPQMYGDEMLEKVRQTDWGSKIRVIVLTNISKDEAPTSLRVLGVDRYVVKAHHTPAQILEIVKDILNIPRTKKVGYT